MDPDIAVLRAHAHPLAGADDDHDALLDAVGDARFVLLGEASHGTHEFYTERARITRRLVEERGFDAVAVEADWPDASRVHAYVHARGSDTSAAEALGDFARFPRWMWRNEVVARLIEDLRATGGVGFYGLDLYSLHRSVSAVLDYLDRTDPEAAARARDRYGCLEEVRLDCEDEVVAQLVELQERAVASLDGDDPGAAFFAEQNARLVKNAEAYQRAIVRGDSWNVRDTHMADTLDRLAEHLGPQSRIVVWAHNSHVGDARATQMGAEGDLNVGQLVRERHDERSFNVGFTTHAGTVRAADVWEGRDRVMDVNPSVAGSYEAAFHAVGGDDLAWDLSHPAVAEVLGGPRPERMIGVIYRPRTERASHYVACRLPEQFDWIIHIDQTTAVAPLG